MTLPGLGDGDDPRDRRLSAAVDHIVRFVVDHDLRYVVLVAHSWGGYPVNGAAGRLAGIVYYGARIPVAGRSLVDDNPAEGPAVTTLGIPLHCLLGDEDHALPHPGEVFAQRAELTPIAVPGTHEGLVTHPEEIATAILAVN